MRLRQKKRTDLETLIQKSFNIVTTIDIYKLGRQGRKNPWKCTIVIDLFARLFKIVFSGFFYPVGLAVAAAATGRVGFPSEAAAMVFNFHLLSADCCFLASLQLAFLLLLLLECVKKVDWSKNAAFLPREVRLQMISSVHCLRRRKTLQSGLLYIAWLV